MEMPPEFATAETRRLVERRGASMPDEVSFGVVATLIFLRVQR